MANIYTRHASRDTLPAPKFEITKIQLLIKEHDQLVEEGADGYEDAEPCGLIFEDSGNGAYLRTDTAGFESSAIENIPDYALVLIGKLVRDAGLPYHTVDISYKADGLRPGSCGGGECRIYPDGRLVFPKVTWPEGETPGVFMPYEMARAIRGAFLPLNPNRVRNARPDVDAAAREFIRQLDAITPPHEH